MTKRYVVTFEVPDTGFKRSLRSSSRNGRYHMTFFLYGRPELEEKVVTCTVSTTKGQKLSRCKKMKDGAIRYVYISEE